MSEKTAAVAEQPKNQAQASQPAKTRRSQDCLDRTESLAMELFVNRSTRVGINAERIAEEAFQAAAAFFAVADKRRAEAN